MTKNSKDRHKAEKQSIKKLFKKPYVRPHLIEYGNVAKLTTSGGSVPNDGAGTFLIRKVTP